MLEKSARRTRPRRHPGRSGSTTLGLVGLLLVVTGCSTSEEAGAAPTTTPTPMAQLDASAMQVPRIEFCQLVPSDAVEAALGAEPAGDSSWGNGDEEEIAGVGTEVVQEIGCSWEADSGATARAWVFARPVDAAFARTVVRAAGREKGCRTQRGTAYGNPAVTQTCRLDDVRRVRYAGLFGQTWLTCELAASDTVAAVGVRARPWCVEVANALDTTG